MHNGTEVHDTVKPLTSTRNPDKSMTGFAGPFVTFRNIPRLAIVKISVFSVLIMAGVEALGLNSCTEDVCAKADFHFIIFVYTSVVNALVVKAFFPLVCCHNSVPLFNAM